MLIKKAVILIGLVLFLAACSNRTPDPLIKEDVQASSQEDYEYLKETSANAPLKIDLEESIAMTIV